MTARIRLSLFIAAAIAVMLSSSCKNKQKKERPNIILILSDDMGYSDLGCYGGEIQTPNLDELAEGGLRFTQFYNSARSCPTRASLMTGLQPHQTGIGHMTNTPTNFTSHDYGLPAYKGYLNDHCATLGELLGQAGYNTLMTGKWHLGIGEKERWPLQRGFDKFYGIVAGACNYFNPLPPRGLNLGNDTVMPQGEDYYTTDAFTDYAMKFIDQSEAEDEKPFFLYLAYNAPHWPLHAPKEVIDKYRGQYMDGWQSLRKERYERMKQMGLIEPGWELTPQDSRDWIELSEQKKKE